MRKFGSLLTMISLIATIFVAPSAYSATEIPVKFSASDFPKDVKIKRAWATVNYGASVICFDTEYPGSEKGMMLTDVAVVAPTAPLIKLSPSRNFIYFNQAESCAVFEQGDIWAGASELTITARARVGNYTFYDGTSFAPMVKKLEALGIKVKESYVAFSVLPDGVTFSVYVDIETTAADGTSLIGRTLRIGDPQITSKERSPIPLSLPDKYVPITEGSLVLGTTRQEIDLNLTSHLINASFEWVDPLVLTSKVETPVPLTFTLDTPSVVYDAKRDRSTVGVMISGSFDKDRYLDLTNLKLSGKKLSKSSASYGAEMMRIYVPFSKKSAHKTESKGYLSFELDGHFHEAGELTLSGLVREIPISEVDFSKVRVPKGVRLEPNFGGNFYYDPKKKETQIYGTFSAGARDSLVLERKNASLTGGKIDSRIPSLSAAYPIDDAESEYRYQVYFGSIKGDVRSGKSFQVMGQLLLHPRTKVNSTMSGDLASRGIYLNEYSLISAEIWQYSAKKRMTAPRFSFENYDKVKATIHGCNIQATQGEKIHKMKDQVFELTGKKEFEYFDRPFIPGDVRFGAKPIELSGSFQLTPCS